MKRLIPLLLLGSALAGCSAADNGQSSKSDVTVQEMTQPASDTAADAKGAAADKVKVSLPQLAYSYSLGYLLPTDKLGAVQDAHRRLCEEMGPARCQLLAFERDDSQDKTGDAMTKLRVATSEAHRFSDALGRAAADAGGRATGTKVSTDDVSKQIVDTKARIAQRELLVARLTDVLRTRSGKVSELVEAERSVAAAQEELDQARGWLTELQGRVAMSDFEIRYSAIAPTTNSGSVAGQLTEAGQGSFASFLIGVRALLTLAIYLLPWVLLAIPVVLLVRRKRAKPAEAA